MLIHCIIAYYTQAGLVQIAFLLPATGDSEDVLHIGLFHLARMNNAVPHHLKAILEHPAIIKAGRNVGCDVRQVTGHGIMIDKKHVLELGRNARVKGFVDDGKVGLDVLSAVILKQRLPKPKDVQCSDWSANKVCVILWLCALSTCVFVLLIISVLLGPCVGDVCALRDCVSVGECIYVSLLS